MAKYSYMPVDQKTSNIEDCSSNGYGYFIDSDETILWFRNQYGRKYVLTSIGSIRWAVFLCGIVSFLIGKIF